MSWTYHFWWSHRGDVDQPQCLRADHIIEMHWLKTRHTPRVDDWLMYMEMAYMSCRLLLISSTVLHLEAFYCAAQTLERGMKAVITHRGLDVLKGQKGHDLPALAESLGDDFNEAEFIELCRRLQSFQEAGRYPDNDVSHFAYPLSILTFLDGFVVRCRALCGNLAGSSSWTSIAVTEGRSGNEVQQAAVVAICDNNRFLPDLGIADRDDDGQSTVS